MTKTQSSKRPSKKTAKAPKVDAAAVTPKPAKTRDRDPRLPAAGTTLTREYKGETIRVSVLEDGFRCDGKDYRSLSALASEICGNSANGFLWFGLIGRKAVATDTAKETPTAPAKKRAPKVRRAGHDPQPAAADAAPESAPAGETATA